MGIWKKNVNTENRERRESEGNHGKGSNVVTQGETLAIQPVIWGRG